MDIRRRGRARRDGGAAGLVLLVIVIVAGCGGGDAGKAARPTAAPVTTGGSSASTAGSASSGLPCESGVFLEVLREQGSQFNVSPAVLDSVQPSGPPKCQGPFATQVFAGGPDGSAPFPVLFGPTPDRTAWALVSVDCNLAEPAGDRRAC